MKKGKAKFFCENCGAEVPENAKMCKNCGKFFISVRCPNCGKTGTSSEFKNGCPNCGYAVGNNGVLNSKNSENSKTLRHASALNQIFSSARRFSNSRAKKNEKNEYSLPAWIYILTVSMLVAVMIGVYSCIKNPLY